MAVLSGQVFTKLTTFLKSLGVKAVFDTSCSRDLALIEACNEFITRYRESQASDGEKSKSSLPMLSSACPGMPNFLLKVCVSIQVLFQYFPANPKIYTLMSLCSSRIVRLADSLLNGLFVIA